MTLTPWFPGDTCPYRVGVYQRDFGRERKYAYWTGLAWRLGNETPETAQTSAEFSPVQLQFDSVRWRGLVEPAE